MANNIIQLDDYRRPVDGNDGVPRCTMISSGEFTERGPEQDDSEFGMLIEQIEGSDGYMNSVWVPVESVSAFLQGITNAATALRAVLEAEGYGDFPEDEE